MDDLISRQEAIEALSTTRGVLYPIRTIEELPAVNQWILCSERLPEDNTMMLVDYIDRPYAGDIWIGWHEMENVWYIDGVAHSSEFGNEVIAWMPLPKSMRIEN